MSNFDRTGLGKRVSDLNVSPQFDGYSGVEIVIDEETSVFSGNTTGRVLTINNPWGTQEQADNILASIQGFQYQPYEASGALLTPAAELGDAVSVNGVYSGIYRMSRNHSALMDADISAPQDEEIDHEYPFEPKEDRDIQRRFTQVESEFTLQSNAIAAKVSQTGGDNSSFGWQLVSDHFSLFSGSTEVFRVDSSGATVKGVITATAGKIGGFNIGSNSVWNNINNFANSGNISTGVYLGTDGIRLGKLFAVDTSGNVTAKKLTVDTLVIGGSNVSASTLNNRANSAYTSTSAGGYCYTGAGYGNAYNSAINANSENGGLKCNYLRVAQSARMQGNLLVQGTFGVGAHSATWKTVTISGTTINYLGY